MQTTNGPGTPVLAIGLDSADRDLIDRWIADGSLPALGSLREAGVWGALSPPPGLGNNAAWPSFFTGAAPDVHGRYTYRTIAPRSYRVGAFAPGDYRCAPFWDALGAAGRRCAVVDVPKAPLSPAPIVVQVADWVLHDPIYPAPRSAPPAWVVAFQRRCGGAAGRRPAEGCAAGGIAPTATATGGRRADDDAACAAGSDGCGRDDDAGE